MVVRVQLTIRHIRGHTFPIETDAESDILGLKVQIWESQKIPIENQRLVFGGKELQDNVTLSQANIGDNAIVFLVEAIPDVPQELQAEIPQVVVQVPSQVVVPPAFTNANLVADGVVPTSTGAVVFQQPCVMNGISPVNVNYYGPLELETASSEERIQRVMALSRWVRAYFILGVFTSALFCFASLYSLILLVIYIFGYVGTRRVNRCLLVLPLLWVFLLAFIGTPVSIYSMAVFPYVFTIFDIIACFFHIFIFASMCKLMSLINKLSCQECCQTRARIRAKGFCC